MVLLALATVAVAAGCGASGNKAVRPVPRAVAPAGSGFTPELDELEPGEKTKGQVDLDADGTADCWQVSRSHGGGHAGYTATVRPRCQGAVLTLSTVSSLRRMVYTRSLSWEWRKRPGLLLGVLDLLFGGRSIRRFGEDVPLELPAADPSFRWLRSLLAERSLGPSGPFDETRSYDDAWEPGPPQAPPSQVALLVASDARRPIADVLEEAGDASSDGKPAPRPYGVLVYRAHVHGPFEVVSDCAEWRLYSTGHGLAVYDRDTSRSSWIWVARRMRHPRLSSVLDTSCAGELIVLEPNRSRSDRALIVIAPSLGRLGRIELGPDQPWRVDTGRQELRIGPRKLDLEALQDRLAQP